MDYDTEQKPLRVNYMTLDSLGNITTVVDGHAMPGPTLAELTKTEARALTAFTETISENLVEHPADPWVDLDKAMRGLGRFLRVIDQ